MASLAQQAKAILKDAVADIERAENYAMAVDGPVLPTRQAMSDADFDKFARKVIHAYRILDRPRDGGRNKQRKIMAVERIAREGERRRR